MLLPTHYLKISNLIRVLVQSEVTGEAVGLELINFLLSSLTIYPEWEWEEFF